MQLDMQRPSCDSTAARYIGHRPVARRNVANKAAAHCLCAVRRRLAADYADKQPLLLGVRTPLHSCKTHDLESPQLSAWCSIPSSCAELNTLWHRL